MRANVRCLILAAVLLLGLLSFAALAEENGFADVQTEDYFNDAVSWAVSSGITVGVGANDAGQSLFGPEGICTRGQVVTFLWRAMGFPEPESAENPFADVIPGSYYEQAVLWAVEQGITNGTAADAFSPDRDCTCGQIITFLWRAAGAPEAGGPSALTADWPESYYRGAAAWADVRDMLAIPGEDFDPDALCTRAMTVTYLYRYYRSLENGTDREPPEAPDGPDVPDGPEETVQVSTTAELLDAIVPNRTIVLAPGRYNISDYLSEIWARDGAVWNRAHPYARIEECHDGLQLVIHNVEDLSLRGGGEDRAETELVTDPRYADVLRFEECSGISLRGLTMGHTDRGNCVGSVLYFVSCNSLWLEDLDLYGCGVVGISAEDIRDLKLYNSTIRDCYYGPVEVDAYGCALYFENCVFRGNGGGFYFNCGENSEIAFVRCTFGAVEGPSVWQAWGVDTCACTWEDFVSQELPEGEAPAGDFRAGLQHVPFDAGALPETGWSGILLQNEAEGTFVRLPFRKGEEAREAHLYLHRDGTAELEGLYETDAACTWRMEPDSSFSAVLQAKGDGATVGTFSLYVDPILEESPLWMLLYSGDNILWLSCNVG